MYGGFYGERGGGWFFVHFRVGNVYSELGGRIA